MTSPTPPSPFPAEQDPAYANVFSPWVRLFRNQEVGEEKDLHTTYLAIENSEDNTHLPKGVSREEMVIGNTEAQLLLKKVAKIIIATHQTNDPAHRVFEAEASDWHYQVKNEMRFLTDVGTIPVTEELVTLPLPHEVTDYIASRSGDYVLYVLLADTDGKVMYTTAIVESENDRPIEAHKLS